MKSGRRTDSESLRRDSRDLSHNVNRFRKRPSMLSEFHGSKHYNYRELERDGPDVPHFRSPYHRHSNDTSSSGPIDSRYGTSSSSSSGFYKSKSDPRARHPYHHYSYRSSSSSSSSHHFHGSSNAHHHSSEVFDEEVPVKRPRLSVDVSRRASSHFDAPNSADSVASSSNFTGGSATPTGLHQSPAVSPLPGSGIGGLSAYLEDIDSDDDDSLLRDEEDDKFHSSSVTKSTTTMEPSHNHQGLPSAPSISSQSGVKVVSPVSPSPKPSLPSKEELLQMMEKVDRDIAATETQIATLQKKQAELEESAKLHETASLSPPLSTPSPHHTSPKTPSPDLDQQQQPPSPSVCEGRGEESEEEEVLGEMTPVMSPSEPSGVGQRLSPKRSVTDTIYAENKNKARSAQMTLGSMHFPPLPALGVIPLYHQPSEAPHYRQTILNHSKFRPRLLDYIRRRKLQKHRSEMKLCERYDSLAMEWEKRVNRMENSSKKRARDVKNRELFEKCFPELKHRREQQERFTRVDQRGFGVVRSDADLSELAIELFEQEEASVRYHKTHAIIPPMVVDRKEIGVRFHSSNGLIADPMALHREAKFINVWTDEEKRIFREKYLQYPKNFETISSFLPNKSAAECVKYYYLSKKSENFKQVIRKANFKRKKTYIKQGGDGGGLLPCSSSSLLSSTSSASLSNPPSFLEDKGGASLTDSETQISQPIRPVYGEWSEEEIESLKEGLRKYGRAWGKVYREVGGRKTATQCKQFYDELYNDEKLKLYQALEEHSKMKNAEKVRRKAESRKTVSTVIAEAKKKAQKQQTKPQPSLHNQLNVDSENTESGSDSETNSDESESESTITDSSPEEASSKTEPNRQRGRKSSSNYRSSEEALDLFISAAEALNNIVPPEIALHDHSYALPPDSLINSVELQGTTGLSLIAAAAAVVSPSLARNAGSGKSPSLSPVRAPRGRPPNSQRRGGSTSTSKLSPSLLSPAGSSTNVPLTDMKTSAFRSRARSAPTDRPKSSMLHLPRPSSNLTRMSLSSTSRTTTNRGSIMPPASYSRQRSDSPSLKSMIALHPHSSNTTTSSSNGATSAFEALVNVAAAAPPAELPKTSSSSSVSTSHSPPLHLTTSNSSTSSSTAKTSGAHSTPATPINARPQPSRTTHQKDSHASVSSTTNSTPTTAYLDVHQTINILVSLAQQNLIPSNSTSSGSHAAISLLAQTPVLTGLGAIVTQANSKQDSNTSESSSATGTSAAKSLSTKANTLLGHLTSGTAANSLSKQVRTSSASSSSTLSNKSESAINSGSKPFSLNSNSNSSNDHSKGSPTVASSLAQSLGVSDDLSNLNLLSSLVAAVAATQSTPVSVNSNGSSGGNNGSLSTASTTSSQGRLTTTSSVTTTANSSTTSSSSHPSSLVDQERPVDSPATVGDTSSGCGNSSSSNSDPSSPDDANRGEGTSSLQTSSVASAIDKQAFISSTLSNETFTNSSASVAAAAGRETENDGESPPCSNSLTKGMTNSGLLTSFSTDSFSSSASAAVDDLPRSVVRTSSAALARGEVTLPSSKHHFEDVHHHTTHNSTPSSSSSSYHSPQQTNTASNDTTSLSLGSGGDMTASLASIIPSFNPQQSSLLLYTRSLSFPMSSSATEPSPEEEEDHLESATRGISELSKLLGTTDNSTSDSVAKHDSSVCKGRTAWNPVDLLTSTMPSSLSNSVTQTFPKHNTRDFNSVPVAGDDTRTKFSGLLESQIHGTVHHNPVPSPSGITNSSAKSPSNRNSNETTVDLDHPR